MAKIGRNEPCPCNSGRKYKLCCLGKAASGYTSDQRLSALERLHHFALKPAIDVELEEAEEHFFMEHDAEPEDSDFEKVEQLTAEVFTLWSFLDYDLRDGSRLVDSFLESDAPLSTGERRYLEALRTLCMRPYEVTGVGSDDTLGLRDLLDGSEVEVRDNIGVMTFAPSDLLAARINPSGVSGRPEFEGWYIPLPPGAKERLRWDIRERRDAFKRCFPQSDEANFLRTLPPFLHSVHFHDMVPAIVGIEGEECRPCRVTFDILDQDGLLTILQETDVLELVPGADAWDWVEPGKGGEDQVFIGRFRYEGGCLTFEAPSEDRAARAEGLLERLAPGLMRRRPTTN